MYSYNYYDSPMTTTSSNAGVWAIVTIIVAICGGIVLYFTFLNPKNENKYTGFVKTLYDFLGFKTMTLETILKICYLVLAIWITLSSFSVISQSFVAFLLVLILGNLIVRILFEGSLLILLIYRRLVDINSKLPEKKEKVKEVKESKETKEETKSE